LILNKLKMKDTCLQSSPILKIALICVAFLIFSFLCLTLNGIKIGTFFADFKQIDLLGTASNIL
jgi:hypothetical protein